MRMLGTVRGMRDHLVQDMRIREQVLERLRDVAQQFRFAQIRTPILEKTELFQRSLGDESDIVMKEMYTFRDKSENQVTLRPEGTAGVARALLNGANGIWPQKVFYVGNMYRYERPQRGRYREFEQFGVEYVGSNSPSSDVEVIEMAKAVLDSLRLKEEPILHLNSLGSNNCRAKYKVALTNYFEKYKDELSKDSQMRLERGNPLRILDSKSPKDIEILKDSPQLPDFLSADSLKRFDAVRAGLEALSIPYEWNTKLVRGLDYYSHTAFEFIEGGGKVPSIALIAGGRYDDLYTQLGGQDVPAIGWAAGVDRLCLEQQLNQPQEPATVAVIPFDKEDDLEATNSCLKIAQSLRQSGWNVHLCPSEWANKSRPKKQFKSADRFGCKVAVIVGAEELASNTVSIKNFESRAQTTVSLEDLLPTIEKFQ